MMKRVTSCCFAGLLVQCLKIKLHNLLFCGKETQEMMDPHLSILPLHMGVLLNIQSK